jgi:hypothetical protein
VWVGAQISKVTILVLGANFNLIRSSRDKNNNNINEALMDKFNMFIDLHQL